MMRRISASTFCIVASDTLVVLGDRAAEENLALVLAVDHRAQLVASCRSA